MSIRYLFPCLVVAFVLFLMANGLSDFGPDREILGFPAAVGAVCILLALLSLRAERQALQAERGGRASARAQFDESEGLLQDRRTWLQMLWLAGFGAACYALGFLIGPFVAVAGYFLADGHRPHRAVVAGILCSVVIWLIFVKLLGTPMPVLPLYVR